MMMLKFDLGAGGSCTHTHTLIKSTKRTILIQCEINLNLSTPFFLLLRLNPIQLLFVPHLAHKSSLNRFLIAVTAPRISRLNQHYNNFPATILLNFEGDGFAQGFVPQKPHFLLALILCGRSI